MPPRPRPFSQLLTADVVKRLFEAAFDSDAKAFEDLEYELIGGDEQWSGRGIQNALREAIIDAARKAFALDCG